ncbi:TVP38/TMEM64 family protein [Dyella jiangningensis]|uniref:TVP38/TMEM64 family membrane protein n=1 Tax=Dyella jiangningensis TaxID=1379159 RepID=A0A328P0P5_9GAMM|nr:VTT domain-containing protein [Dyella jiangningensis]RAO75629.1 TVP38/TMEM64 family protein [Dyella jiangningensis]
MSRLRAALPLILLVVAGIVLFSSGALDRLHPEQLVMHQAQLRTDIANAPWLSRITFIGLLTLAMSTGIPGTVIIIMAGGFAFGALEGSIYGSIGLTLGTLILFLASRYAFGAGSKHPPAIVDKLHHGFERHPVAYTMFLRFIPVAPFGLITVGLAWLRCPLWLFLGASWLGGTVSLIFETSIGAGLGEALAQSQGHFGLGLLMQRSIWMPLSAIGLLALLPLLVERFSRRRRQAGLATSANSHDR